MRIGLGPVPGSEMGLKLRRRSVYVATVVAILAMAGGFALAAFPNAFTGFGGPSSNQNQGTFSGGNTIWSTGASVALIQAAASATCGTPIYAGAAASVYLDGAGPCGAGPLQWYEDFTFAATELLGDSDTFHWFVVGGVDSADQSFPIAYSATYSPGVTLHVFVDMGAASAPPGTLTSISATVAGS